MRVGKHEKHKTRKQSVKMLVEVAAVTTVVVVDLEEVVVVAVAVEVVAAGAEEDATTMNLHRGSTESASVNIFFCVHF